MIEICLSGKLTKKTSSTIACSRLALSLTYSTKQPWVFLISTRDSFPSWSLLKKSDQIVRPGRAWQTLACFPSKTSLWSWKLSRIGSKTWSRKYSDKVAWRKSSTWFGKNKSNSKSSSYTLFARSITGKISSATLSGSSRNRCSFRWSTNSNWIIKGKLSSTLSFFYKMPYRLPTPLCFTVAKILPSTVVSTQSKSMPKKSATSGRCQSPPRCRIWKPTIHLTSFKRRNKEQNFHTSKKTK